MEGRNQGYLIALHINRDFYKKMSSWWWGKTNENKIQDFKTSLLVGDYFIVFDLHPLISF